MGTQLHNLKQGDAVEVKGPFQQWKFTKGKYNQYGIVAGGTGITPLIQAADYILQNDTAKVTFTTFNKTPGDVLLRQELAALEKAYPDRLTVVHFVEGGEKDPSCRQAGKCCMQRNLKEVLPAPGDGVLVMVCGRKEMTDRVAGPKTPDFKQGEVGGILKDIGFETKHVHKF
jgi:cytochrome-b5 reductase